MLMPVRSLVGVLMLLVLAGCEGARRPPGAKPTVPVKVTVTYQGAPVEGAMIAFLVDPPAFGRTDASGVARMKTYVEGDGSVVGTHKVTIIKAEAPPDTSADVSTPEYVPPDPNAPAKEVKHLIPVKYSSPSTSGLTADVTESGPNDVKFDLTD